MGSDGIRKSAFIWNVSHLRGETIRNLSETWANLLDENIIRHYRELSKHKAKEYRKEELNTKAKLDLVIATLHEDVFDQDKQRVVS